MHIIWRKVQSIQIYGQNIVHELLIHTTKMMNLKFIFLSQERQTKKSRKYSFITDPGRGKTVGIKTD